MPVRRKVFRIEQALAPTETPGALGRLRARAGSTQVGITEIVAELNALHTLLAQSRAPAGGCGPSQAGAIHDVLERTRHEIAALHRYGFADAPSRASLELDAVAAGAEQATGRILDAAEAIDDAAQSLSASVARDQERALALDIRDQVLRIFEACNFQDLAGQRIAKVLETLAFVEARVAQIAGILGSTEGVDQPAAATGRDHLLNGPSLAGDDGFVTQAEVDALLAAS